mgnify:CR=1 FL=1
MVRFLLIALAVFVAYKIFTTAYNKRREADEKSKKDEFAKRTANGELNKDQVCGAYASAEASVRSRDGD